MTYSQDIIDKVRDANNIVDLFSEYTQLKRSGGRLMGRCPFPGHNEKTPSFSVSEDKQVYHCFGCQRSGQIFTALKELKGLSFPEAMEHLAQRAGIILPQKQSTSKVDLEAKSHREQLFRTNTFAAKVFHEQLKKASVDHPASQYCLKRRLSASIIETFQIGYAPDQWEVLVRFLQNAKAPLEIAAELGLIRQRKDGSGFFDLFRDRLMFPIYSHKGECVGFGGRALTDAQTPKYLNSPESELFSKGSTLYGLNETAKFIRAEDSVVVVEGYMDFLALYAAGIQNVVATLGTALTASHAKLLQRYTANVTVLFDGDAAGQKAAVRSLPVLLDEQLLPKAIALPDQLDPDEFIEERGANALRELLKSAPDLFSVVLDRFLLDYRGSAADKVVLLDAISPMIAATRDPRLRDLYISEVAQKISVEAAWVHKNLAKEGSRAKEAEIRHPVTPQLPRDVIEIAPKVPLTGAPKAELFLLNIAMMSPERLNAITGSGTVEQMNHVGIKTMLLEAQSRHRQMPKDFAKLSAYLMTLTEHPKALGLHLGEPIVSMSGAELDKLMSDCIHQVKERYLRNKTRELAAQLRASPKNEQSEKLEQIMNVQISKQTLRRDREP